MRRASSGNRAIVLRRLGSWIDDRVGASRFGRSALNHLFPTHWSFLLGEIALYSFVVLIATGIYLTFLFVPSGDPTTYHGAYAPLEGTRMSEAYASVVRISWDHRAGLLIRQVHHWAALVFLAAIVAHLCRVFFTGAYRRPRELNWVIGVTMMLLAMLNGFAGYSMVDDLLSGTGLRIGYSIALSTPVVGPTVTSLLFGGEFPDASVIPRLYVLHILLVPALIVALLSIHLALVWRQRHTQYPGGRAREDNLIGVRLWPSYAAKSVGLLAGVAAVLVALGGLVQINPVWLWGPSSPTAVTTSAQPDWYMGPLEGALRLAGPWRVELGPFTLSELFVPAILLPAATVLVLLAWPFVDGWRTKDRAEHGLLQRPRDHPTRTGVGVGVIAFYTVLFVAGAQDVIAQITGASIAHVQLALRIAAIVVPIAAGTFASRLCRDLREEAPTPGAPALAGATSDVDRATTRSTAPAILDRMAVVLAVVAVGISTLARRRRRHRPS